MEWVNVVIGALNLLVTGMIAWVVHRGSRRVFQLEHDRGIKDAWVAIDQAALESTDNMRLLDQMLHPDDPATDEETMRRRWLAYMILNPLEAAWTAGMEGHMKREVVQSSEQAMRGLVRQPDVYRLIQEVVYSAPFRDRCKLFRDEWLRDQGATG